MKILISFAVKRNEYGSALFMHRPMRLIIHIFGTIYNQRSIRQFDSRISYKVYSYGIEYPRMSQCRRIPGPHARQPPTLGRRIRRAVSPSPAKSPSFPYLSVHSYFFPSVLLIQYLVSPPIRSGEKPLLNSVPALWTASPLPWPRGRSAPCGTYVSPIRASASATDIR